jgi:hypothetical protein
MKRPVLLLLTLVIIPALIACGGGDGDGGGEEPEPTPTVQAASPAEQALGRHIEATFQRQYVGDCSKANVATDVGKMCSVKQGERNNAEAFAIGPTFSEGSHFAFVENRGGQWVVFGVTQITPAMLAVPGIPWPMRPGDEVVVVGVGSCGRVGEGLNVREGPGLNQAAVDCVGEGTRIRIGAGPVEGDNLQWYQIEGRAGWVSGVYLRFPDALQ